MSERNWINSTWKLTYLRASSSFCVEGELMFATWIFNEDKGWLGTHILSTLMHTNFTTSFTTCEPFKPPHSKCEMQNHIRVHIWLQHHFNPLVITDINIDSIRSLVTARQKKGRSSTSAQVNVVQCTGEVRPGQVNLFTSWGEARLYPRPQTAYRSNRKTGRWRDLENLRTWVRLRWPCLLLHDITELCDFEQKNERWRGRRVQLDTTCFGFLRQRISPRGEGVALTQLIADDTVGDFEWEG